MHSSYLTIIFIPGVARTCRIEALLAPSAAKRNYAHRLKRPVHGAVKYSGTRNSGGNRNCFTADESRRIAFARECPREENTGITNDGRRRYTMKYDDAAL